MLVNVNVNVNVNVGRALARRVASMKFPVRTRRRRDTPPYLAWAGECGVRRVARIKLGRPLLTIPPRKRQTIQPRSGKLGWAGKGFRGPKAAATSIGSGLPISWIWLKS